MQILTQSSRIPVRGVLLSIYYLIEYNIFLIYR